MRRAKALIVLVLLILASGCFVRSLHPLYTEGDIIFDSRLVGTWSDESSKGTWEFSRKNEKEYKLVCTDEKGISGTFDVHLLKVKGKIFLDLFPSDPELKQNDFYQLHILPIHSFAYVKQIEPTLQMSLPDPDWLKRFVADNPKAIQHEKIDDEVFLTASTKDLQEFWLKHLETKGAFGEAGNMERKTTTVPEEKPNRLDADGGK